ncbi:MAG: type VII toxin-antitoxin system HepT family RNase toxin [Candidatus Hodarchaeales archaeon]|jgi:uncharacterized protein YutE (UPF0331/DUF86 family)
MITWRVSYLRIELIIKKLEQIKHNISIIRNNLPQRAEEFEKLGLVKDGIYKRVEYSIELVIDICSIINRDLRLGIPNSESDIIDNLVKHEIITPELKDKIRGMKAFRNVIVHRYGRIDDIIAYDMLNENLSDFNDFEKEITNIIKKERNRVAEKENQ